MLCDGSKSQETKVVDLKRETDKSTMKAGHFKSPSGLAEHGPEVSRVYETGGRSSQSALMGLEQSVTQQSQNTFFPNSRGACAKVVQSGS